MAELIKKMTKICKEKVDPLNKAKRAEVRKIKNSRMDYLKINRPNTKAKAIEQGINPTTPAPEVNKIKVMISAPVNKRIKPGNRNIPAQIKHQVWLRDQGKCTFENCNSKYLTQTDHIIPFAKGEQHTLENLGLRCFAHNQ